MRYQDVKRLSSDKFKRLVGVQPNTFLQMLDELKPFESNFGRPPKLILEDRLLLALSYWREYRTLMHTGISYGVSEPTASRIVRQVEDHLIQSGLFNLPKDIPEGEGIDWNVVIVDATEIPIQRPKKTIELL